MTVRRAWVSVPMINIILNSDDMPTKAELADAVSRLRKCSEVLKTIRSKKKDEDPAALAAVANFLEMLSKRDA